MTSSAGDKCDFFVSFNQTDRKWATWIAWVLEAAGYSVFFQDWDFKGSFMEQMHQASLRARHTLVVLSDNYLRSEYARSEAWAALACDPVGREDRIVTVKVGPIGDLGFFSHFGYLDITDSTEADAEHLLLGRAKQSLDPTYRPKPSTRPDFPGRSATKPPFPAPATGPSAGLATDASAEHRAEKQKREVFRDIDAPWCPEMVVIPPGTFMMGSTETECEKPRHRVKIEAPLAAGRYPVTFEEFDRFAAATREWRPDDWGMGRARWPVINVTWNDAKAYVAWLSQATGKPYRLLSEAEWEYACRAGTITRYSWGDDPPTPEQANFGGKVGTTEVGSYPPNAWGLYDMHGNVLEWVEDCWHESYEGAPTDGSAWLDQVYWQCRVLRGGSWQEYHPEDLRSAARHFLYVLTDQRYPSVSFRVARAFR